jgi:hypothetical protein
LSLLAVRLADAESSELQLSSSSLAGSLSSRTDGAEAGTPTHRSSSKREEEEDGDDEQGAEAEAEEEGRSGTLVLREASGETSEKSNRYPVSLWALLNRLSSPRANKNSSGGGGGGGALVVGGAPPQGGGGGGAGGGGGGRNSGRNTSRKGGGRSSQPPEQGRTAESIKAELVAVERERVRELERVQRKYTKREEALRQEQEALRTASTCSAAEKEAHRAGKGKSSGSTDGAPPRHVFGRDSIDLADLVGAVPAGVL